MTPVGSKKDEMTTQTGHWKGELREGNLLGMRPHSACASCSDRQDSSAWSYLCGRNEWVWPLKVTGVVSTRPSTLTRTDMVRVCLDSPSRKSVCRKNALIGVKHAVPSFKHNGGSGSDSHHLPRVSRVNAGVLRSLTTTVRDFHSFFGKGARTLLSVNVERPGFLASARERWVKSMWLEVAEFGEKTKKSLFEQAYLEDTVAIGRVFLGGLRGSGLDPVLT